MNPSNRKSQTNGDRQRLVLVPWAAGFIDLIGCEATLSASKLLICPSSVFENEIWEVEDIDQKKGTWRGSRPFPRTTFL